MIQLLAQISPEEALAEIRPGEAADAEPFVVSAMSLLNTYSLLFVVAFVVTLLATPLVRKAAMAANIVDLPDKRRKQHRQPVPYLGGMAVFLGLMCAIGFSYVTLGGATDTYRPIPLSVILGLVLITFTGLADDVWGWDPRLKIAGQLVAAAALAVEDVGVRVAEGFFRPLLGGPEDLLIALDWLQISNGDLYYWIGTAIIAFFVLGGCNAANLIDGLDGLLAGTIGIVALGLLAISLMLAVKQGPDIEEPTLGGARVALSLALLGAVLGFLPHNFNPASIFLGDCGSLMLGYMSVVIILMLGDQGQTHIVAAGLIVFAVPVMDTVLAIVRRKLSGRSMSSADNQHIHHQLRRSLGGVKRAVFALYGITAVFALVGVTLAFLVMHTSLKVRVIYAIAIVLFGFIGVMAFKAARRHELAVKAAIVKQREQHQATKPDLPKDGVSPSPAPSKPSTTPA